MTCRSRLADVVKLVIKCIIHLFLFVSFFNWETQTSTSNPTPNYQVIAENASGLLFKNKRDRKILNVDPKVRLVLRNVYVIRFEINWRP